MLICDRIWDKVNKGTSRSTAELPMMFCTFILTASSIHNLIGHRTSIVTILKHILEPSLRRIFRYIIREWFSAPNYPLSQIISQYYAREFNMCESFETRTHILDKLYCVHLLQQDWIQDHVVCSKKCHLLLAIGKSRMIHCSSAPIAPHNLKVHVILCQN